MSEPTPKANDLDERVAAGGADYLSPPPLSARPSLPGWLAGLTVALAAVAVPSWLLGLAISLNQLGGLLGSAPGAAAAGQSPAASAAGGALAALVLALIAAALRATLRARRGHPLTRVARILITLMWLIAPLWPLALFAAALGALF